MLRELWLNVERLARQTGVTVKRRSDMAVRKTKKGASLRKWFAQNKGKGWVDCKTGKPCGRSGSKKDSKRGYPACRPTMAQCKTAAAKTAMRKKNSSSRVSWRA
jgi:hypothetical protein